jgi:glutathione S-transferase
MMDKMTLVIGNKNYSSWSLRPWAVLKHFKIPFDEILIPLRLADSKEKILKFSPAGKVPILIHGKTTVWESLAICEYLAFLFPEKNLWPKDPMKRAAGLSISSEMHAGFINLRKTCPMNVRARKSIAVTPEVDADIKRIQEIWTDCRTKYKKDGDFLLGAFSIADAMYAPVVYRFQSYGIKTEGAVKEYCQNILKLPVYQEWDQAALVEPYVIENH